MKAIVITLIQYVVYENRAVERAKQPDQFFADMAHSNDADRLTR